MSHDLAPHSIQQIKYSSVLGINLVSNNWQHKINYFLKKSIICRAKMISIVKKIFFVMEKLTRVVENIGTK